MTPAAYFLGVEIGGTKLQLVLGDAQCTILHRKRFAVDQQAGAKGILAQIETAVSAWNLPVLAAGVGFGGPVNWQTGCIAVSHQISGWAGFELASWLSLLVHAPVVVENDANVAALAEAHIGAGQAYGNVFYLTLGSGVGGGMVMQRQIYHGAVPGEMEAGHLRVDRQGATLESRCSGWAVDARIRKAIAEEPQSILAQLAGNRQSGEARFLGNAIAAGDALAIRMLAETADELAFGLSHVVHLLHPEVLVLGGGLSLIGEPLRKAVQEKLSAYLMEAFRPGPVVKLAALGEDAVPMGALLLAQQDSEL